MRLTVDDIALQANPGEDILTVLAKAGRVPAGCLCWGGDCPNCLAVVDGVAYVRMCQTRVAEGMTVNSLPVATTPPLPAKLGHPSPDRTFEHVDVVVIGAGPAGTAALEHHRSEGSSVAIIDTENGDEALAVYSGPEVVARVKGSIVRYRSERVVVATGAAEIQPVVPGSHLEGILTPRAAAHLVDAGVHLGRTVAIGVSPDQVAAEVAPGTLVRFEGSDRVTAVVVSDDSGTETRHACDTVVVDLGHYPRDVLARMAQPDEVDVVGDAAVEPQLPLCPPEGTVCPCSGVTVENLDSVWERGFHELELIKRATLAGTGTCQGSVCTPYLRSFVADRGGEDQPAFTARPLARQMTMAEAAAGSRFPPIRRTGLDEFHRRAGARMDRMGGWWRPWTYSNDDASPEDEYWAVREGVSLGDVGTLGKMIVRGPDASRFLDRLYPGRIADLVPGRSRYGLLLGESGAVIDDGLVARIDENTFALSFTTGGASFAEAWVRDWAGSWGADVRIMDQTHSVGAINVTGPLASQLMAEAGLDDAMRFMTHRTALIGDVSCRIFRLSFTGEISYELHHPVSSSQHLWTHLMQAGSGLRIRPHGMETLMRLRLEKGHVVVGFDTEPDSTPRRLGMEWAVELDKEDFVGKTALVRTNRIPLDRRLVGLRMDAPAPTDGSAIFVDGAVSGYVTSATWSPVLSSVVMLAWVHLVDGDPPPTVTIDGRSAFVSDVPFYDPAGERAGS